MKTLTTAAKYVIYRKDIADADRSGWPEFSRADVEHLNLSEAQFRALAGGASVEIKDDVFIEQSKAEVWEDHEPEIVAVERTEADHGETGEVRVTVLGDSAEHTVAVLRRYGYRVDREDRHLMEECTGRSMVTGYTTKPTTVDGQKAFVVSIGWALDI